MKNRRNLLGAVLLVLFITLTLHAQRGQWRPMRNQSLITFDWNCSRKDSFPSASLHKIVQRSILIDDRGGPTTYGDRAFVIKLRKARPSVYFVPTVCGATGNCTWRLYTINPVRFVGEINGQYIYTYQSSHRTPMIITYGNYSAMDGVLFTYVSMNGTYERNGRQYPINFQPPNVRPRPAFLETAKTQCKDYGL
jgi:hypothetical protein